MSILYVDGFEQYASGEDLQKVYTTTQVSTSTLLTTTALGRGKCMSVPNSVISESIITLPTQPLNGVIGFTCRIRFTVWPGATERKYICMFYENTVAHVWVSIDQNGYLYTNTNGGGSSNYSPVPLNLNQWYHLEFKTRIHDTTGYRELRVDGKTVCVVDNNDTRNAGNGTINACRFNRNSTATVPGQMDIDDVVIWNGDGTENNDFLGDVEVQTLMPSADDVVTGWTANTGTVWDAVNDDGEDTDVTYISSSTVGSPASFVMGDLLTTPNKILAVQVFGLVRKDDSGTRSVKLGVSSNSVTVDGSDFALGLTYGPTTLVVEKNPDGNVAWTATTVNALKSRIQVSV